MIDQSGTQMREESSAGAALAEEDLLVLDEVHEELVLPVWDPTGAAQVDETLELVQGLSDDVHDHAPVFEEVHRRLRDALAQQES